MSTVASASIEIDAISTASEERADFLDWAHLVFSRLNDRFERGATEELLIWSVETFGTGLSIGTGFGASGIVLIDLALRIQPDVDIFYIDTGYFFPETQELIDQIQQHYRRSLRRVTPSLDIREQSERFGPNLYRCDPDTCCWLRKVAPMETALRDSTAWVTALRRDQATTRVDTPAVTWNERYSVVKLAPMIHWSEADVWEHIRRNNLPYNELHDRGYPSIGCWPCTRAVQGEAGIRSGRWYGLDKTECGLHLDR